MKKLLIPLITILVLVFASAISFAAGPWKGKVIDAETKEPLEGAVVLAIWDRAYRTPTGDSSYFYNSKEVLTDKDGRFEIPSYAPINFLPIISYIRGPYFTIFKPGYGNFPEHRVGPPMDLSTDAIEEFFLRETGKSGEIDWDYDRQEKFKVTFGVVELPKLKTRKERLLTIGSIPPFIPNDKMTKLLELMNKERIDLGLQPSNVKRGVR
ncbi:MAG: carboxypeptidase regulatory-like domain-containing protein [Deltaproteobacteria bacterium]|nr:carboxypeptidase regulatory-like domain-containing protein [Deltaproteobacteria bacterium]